MKVLLLSPWENVWVRYKQRFFENTGHTFKWSKELNFKEVQQYDVVICGWADKMAVELGKYPKLSKKYICYVRSYEYYTRLVAAVDFTNFDSLIFVNKYIMQECVGTVPELKKRSYVINNGIDLDEWKFKKRRKGKKIAFVADISHKKGIPLLMQIVYAMPNHKFYVAGKLAEPRFYEYLKVKKPANLFLEGYKDTKEFLKNKQFILCTSPAEGNPNNVIEGMALGLKPVVHRYLGYKGQFPEECTYNTIEEAKEIINGNYDSYQNFIKLNYDYKKVYKKLEKLCKV